MAERRKTIQTLEGVADFVRTEVERSDRWNDNYYTRDGFYVVHRGEEHDVYRARRRSR